MLVWLAACTRPELPDPVLERASPSFAWNGAPATISLLGRDFWPRVEVDLRGGDASVNPSYAARLLGPIDGVTQVVPLLGVGIVDDDELTATVPEGLAPGLWTVEIEGPSGASSSLPGGFRITDQQAARLAMFSDRLVYGVGETARLAVELRDVDEQVVELPFEVVVVGESLSGLLTVDPGSLRGAEPTPSGDGIRGQLVDGLAVVEITATASGRVDVSLAAGDPYSPVAGDELTLQFEPGEDLEVELELGTPGPFLAGDAFVVTGQVLDQYGNAVLSPTEVQLRTACSGWFGTVLLTGPTQFAVTPVNASSAVCPEDRISVTGSTALSGRSAPFTVAANTTARLDVSAGPPSVRAGDWLTAVVTPQDAWGNRSAWTAGMSVQDSLLGLVDVSCVPILETRVCSARPTLAGPAVVLVATGDDGVSGASNPVVVANDDVVDDLSVQIAGLVAAGADVPVVVQAHDGWGNVIPAAETSGAWVLADEQGDVACVPAGVAGDGSAAFACEFHVARPDALLTVTLDGFAVAAVVDVQNGGLAEVAVTAPSAAVAGSPVALDFVATDAFGNPYVVQDDDTLEIVDATGSFPLASVVLDGSGEASAVGAFTVAGTTRIAAWQGGVELGRSGDISVGPAPTSALRISVGAPWVWVDEPATTTVESVDAFGNRTALDGAGVVSSTATTAPDSALALVNGVAAVVFTWPQAAVPDTLTATVGSFSGELDVVAGRRCANGPAAAFTFAGAAQGVTCATDTDGGAVELDLRSSVRGAFPVSGYAASLGDAVGLVDVDGLMDVVLPGVGEHAIRGLAVDTAGCADEVDGSAWSAPDDGSPAGPIPLSISAPTVPVFGAATLDLVGVTDCEGQPASYAPLWLSTTGGEIPGLSSTGAGLALELDPFGDGTATLDLGGGDLQASTLRVVAASLSGGGRGQLDVPITGDDVRPVVVAVTPTGTSGDLEDTFVVELSEAAGPATVTTGSFTVAGGVVDAVAVSGSTLTFTLDAPVDGAAGPIALSLLSSVRDTANNRLAGEWSGAVATWQSAFGGPPPASSAPSCGAASPPTLRFRPDGDPGSGEEADEVVVAVTAAAAPSWWVSEVRDDAGDLVFVDWEIPVSASDEVSWTGRGFDGRIVPAGRYSWSVSAADGFGNRLPGCDNPVVVVAR